MNIDLFGEQPEGQRSEIVAPVQAHALAAAGLLVTQGPVHVVVPADPAFDSQPKPVAAPLCYAPLPSLERVREVLVEHGVLAQDAKDELHAGMVPAMAQLVAEAQSAPAGLAPAGEVLCWVMDGELQRFASTRVRRALDPFAVNNGQRMYPLCAPAKRREGAKP